MERTILATVDGSALSHTVLHYLPAIVRPNDEIVLLTVLHFPEARRRTSVGYEALREVSRARHAHRKSRKFLLNVHPDVGSRLLEDERRHVEEVEKRLGVQLVIKPDPELHMEGFEVIPV